ncbi:hypothetical protein AX17_001021 [Amanita inopinata Kibby_2008]|nr:hypothetical protein AX17_001021 [Amanita inopinata Kibby_2008]
MSDAAQLAALTARVVEKNMTEADEEALFAELEAEIENDDNPTLREKGLDILKRELNTMKEMQHNSHGSYTEITEEKEVIRASAQEPTCVVHFYHFNFKRCEIMDKHLASLATKYFHTRFFRVFVENVPWLVERLGIKVLPCVMCFVDGVSKDRLVGFEDLGNTDSFSTVALETWLLSCGAINKSATSASQIVYNVRSTKSISTSNNRDDDDVFDLD